MRKRIRYWGMGAGVLLLLAAGAFWCFYGTGERVTERWLPRWSEENVRAVRYSAVKADGSRVLHFRDWEYGPLERPLLKVAKAALKIDPPFAGRWGRLHFRRWELEKAVLQLRQTPAGWTLNGRSIGGFLQELLQIPPGPQGENVPVKLDFQVKDERKETVFCGKCRIDSRPALKDGGRIHMLEIDFIEGPRSGSLRCVINPAARTLECETDGMMSMAILRRIVAATGAPVRSLRLLDPKGCVQGRGRILFSFPELKVAQFQYDGKADAGKFDVGVFSFDHRNPTAFQLRTSSAPGAETVLTIAETVLETPFRLHPKNLELRFRHDAPLIAFGCVCDLAPAFNAGLWGFGLQSLRMAWPLERRITGSYDGREGNWQFKTQALRHDRRILAVSGEQAVFHSDLDHFDLYGKGKRAFGSVDLALTFRNLHLEVGEEKLGSSSGVLQSRWDYNFANPGVTGGVIAGAADLDLADLAVTGSGGHGVSLVQPLGSMELVPASEERQASYHLLLRSNAISTNGWETTLNAGRGTYEISVDRQSEDGGWNLPLLHGRFEQFQIGSPRHDLALEKMEYSGDAELDADWNFRRFSVRGTSESLGGRVALMQIGAKGVEGRLNWRKAGDPEWDNQFAFQSVQTHLGRWEGAYERLKLTASGSGDPLLCEKPAAAQLQAGRIHLANGGTGRSLDLRNADVKLAVEGNWSQNRLQAESAFDKAVLTLGAAGHLESGRTTLAWKGGVNNGVADPGSCTFSAKQFGWRTPLAALGAETMKGELALALADAELGWKMQMDGKNLSVSGEKFSLLMPGGKLSAASLPHAGGAQGHVSFVNGGGMLDWGQIMMDKVTLDADWRLGGEKTDLKTLPRGTFSVGKVLFSNGVSGSVKGTLAQAGAALDVTGELHSDLVKTVGSLALTADWEKRLQWSFSFDFPKTKLARMVDLEAWFPEVAQAVHFGGTLAMQGRFDGDARGFRSSGKVEFEESRWEFGKWTKLDGVTAKVEFRDLANLVSASGAVPLSFRRFQWHDWVLENGRGAIAFLTENRIELAQLSADFAGGRVQSRQPIAFSTAELTRLQEVELPFTAEKISPAVMMPLLGMTRIESDFRLSGTVNAVLRRAQMRYHASELAFHGENGSLGVRHAEQFAVQTNDPVYRDFTLAVLSALRCSKAEFAFENLIRHSRELLQMKVAVDGRPAEPVPFVYQGSSAEAPFRPAEKDEPGFDGEVELSVELQLPCRDVKESW